ncbi:MAG: hypothetical protein K8F25_12400 [Fimbriimonadaceae bacterium]|nr:hypothetical protein [Alphaproteobacteria bacterium]
MTARAPVIFDGSIQGDNILPPRTCIPFDVFSMQVDVPVSMLVRDGDLGWTCGQCPLDRKGEVLAPADLFAQTGIVCDMIEDVLRRGGFSNRSIGKLNVYFAAGGPGEGDKALALIASRFAHGPVIVPIPVPHFYYDGMMIEVDVFAGAQVFSRKISANRTVELQVADGGDTIWAAVRGDLSGGVALADRLPEISSALEQQGLNSARLLSDHWFLADGKNETVVIKDELPESGLMTSPNALVRLGPHSRTEIIGTFVFCREAVQAHVETNPTSGVTLATRHGGSLFWACGICGDPQSDLVEQTRRIMSDIDRALTAENMSFDNVAKLTAHYAGGASADDLHGNMAVRHSFYGKPGPASTGLPVSGLFGRDCLISIDVVAVLKRAG